MKKSLLYSLILVFQLVYFTSFVSAQHKTINLATAGTLSTELTSSELSTISHLTITGSVDARDFKTMRDLMPLLDSVDINAVNIIEYIGTEGTNGTALTTYAANTLPDKAFYQKTILRNIVLPLSLELITSNAFSQTGLLSIVIPDNVVSLDIMSVASMPSLTSLHIGASLHSIKPTSFNLLETLNTITISPENTRFTTEDNVLFSINKDTLLLYPRGKTDVSYTVPNTVKVLWTSAFGKSKFEQITLSNSLVSILAWAFDYANITSLHIPSSVLNIDKASLRNCQYLTEYTVDTDNPKFSSVDGVLFNKDQTKIIRYPLALITDEYTVPTTVTEIEQYCFQGVGFNIILDNPLSNIGRYAFENSTLTKFTVPETVTNIGYRAFYNCTNIDTIVSFLQTPISIVNVFSSSLKYDDIVLMIPSGTISAYQSDPEWSKFTNMVVMSELTYSATITITDGTNPIEGATVHVSDADYTSDAAGQVIASGLLPGKNPYYITADSYQGTFGELNISDENIVLNLTLTEGNLEIVHIPDANFKNYLLNNIDINRIVDNEIQVIEAQQYTGEIYVYNLNISDLTGIESFIAISNLNCSKNPIENIDVSNNVFLETLSCASSSISSLDLSANINLYYLNCKQTIISSLDLSNNTELESVYCNENDSLSELDLRNGNNTNINGHAFTKNPNLTCISVDDPEWSIIHWVNVDEHTQYSANCGLADITFNLSDGTNPIINACITLDNEQYYSDVNGQLIIYSVEPGNYDYTITALGYQNVSGTINVTDQDIIENIRLLLEYDITFDVSDGALPIEGALIHILDKDYNTNAEGKIVIENFVAGSYPYTLTAEGFQDVSGTIILTDQDLTENVTLIRAYQVSFYISDGSLPIEGAEIHIMDTDYSADSDGNLVIEKVVAGSYPYSITAQGYKEKSGTITVADENITENVTLTEFSTDATLTDITIDGASISDFSASTYAYSYILALGTTEIPEITATANHENASVSITQATALPGTASILVTAEDDITQVTYTVEFTVATGISENTFAQMSVYPNPTADKVKINISNETRISSIAIYNVKGECLKICKFNNSANEIEIDFSQFKTGIYMLNIQTENLENTTLKILKQ